MRQLAMLAALSMALLFTSNAKAQTTDYFPGKWKVTVYGTPNGDVIMFFDLARKDGKLTGTFSDSTEKEKTSLSQVEEKDTAVTLYFTTQGYDVNVFLAKLPADSVRGNLMGMFDTKGVRVKDTTKAN